MAKTPKVKKREVSFRSRAARRGASPPAKDSAVKPSAKETDYKPWLHNAQNAGITKKQKAKPLKRQQKVRQQRAMEKADAVVDKLERKVADSKARSKRIQSRAKAWEELNAQSASVKKTAADETVVQDAMVGAEDERQEKNMEDVAMPVPLAEDVNVDVAGMAVMAAEIDAEVDEVI
ncbi:hypothetical protein LTR91_008356 [Friedmanniomyces endolithicus]|uniref:Alb1-domain-containing protein n=1 Tax=Friedmanniomyces endolithicus TaxID=329885 RepID=A0AAN6KMU4_9PEZI|nr:hypothetical protein LTR94_023407 [Friedmanniomyces endolithicus]KAK0767808.1 hypothetical protein LTR59_018143 [Friedmanniomyces endolithicus]KAK0779672.1 hypothetical protein LTR75_015260 [Friedmanniomyces endolithicus]KAK0789896.1 hypothetical protein LTR38_010792 [Friedmanniomyces endolithicus]KAK0848722.1 hypothetical protein LTS02_013923 [Friedmanniomyces endolithicus]